MSESKLKRSKSKVGKGLMFSGFLKPEDRQQFKEIFDIFGEFDVDNSGSISIQQWKDVMKKFGHEASEEQVQEMLRQNNLDENAQITLFEFMGLIQKKKLDMRGDEHMELAKAFRLFDKDLDGTISARELHAGLQRAGESMRLQDIQLLIKMADKDGDGNINFDEFSRIMTLK